MPQTVAYLSSRATTIVGITSLVISPSCDRATKANKLWQWEGPDVIQAATVNSASISVRAGFAGHSSAWINDEIEYYAHPIRSTVGER